MNYGMPPDYQYERSTFDVDDAGLPKYTPPVLALTVQTTDLARRDNLQHEFGYAPHTTPQSSATRRPTSRGRPLPPTPSGPRPMHQQSQTQVVPTSPPPLPVAIPSSPPQFAPMTMSPLTPALTGSSTSSHSHSHSHSIRSPPLPRPSLPPVAESFVSLAPKTPGHICAGRGLDIVFYRGDATALPMYGRGDRIEGYIDLKNTKDICQIEITVCPLSSHLPGLVHCRTSGACPSRLPPAALSFS